MKKAEKTSYVLPERSFQRTVASQLKSNCCLSSATRSRGSSEVTQEN